MTGMNGLQVARLGVLSEAYLAALERLHRAQILEKPDTDIAIATEEVGLLRRAYEHGLYMRGLAVGDLVEVVCVNTGLYGTRRRIKEITDFNIILESEGGPGVSARPSHLVMAEAES